MCNPKYAIVSAWLSLLATSVAAASETPVAYADGTRVPHAVRQAVTERYPEGQNAQFAKQVGHGTTMYSVKLAVAQAPTMLCVAPSGGIQLEQQDVTPASLPESVRRSLRASGFDSSKVAAARRLTRPGFATLPTYDILVGLKGKLYEVMFDSAGLLVLGRHAANCLGTPHGPPTNSV